MKTLDEVLDLVDASKTAEGEIVFYLDRFEPTRLEVSTSPRIHQMLRALERKTEHVLLEAMRRGVLDLEAPFRTLIQATAIGVVIGLAMNGIDLEEPK